MNLTLPGLFLLAVLLAWPATVRADCANPAAEAASIVYNTDHSVMQYCNGAYWVAMGSSSAAGDLWIANGSDIYFNTGNVGIGTTSPAFPFEVVSTDAAATGHATMRLRAMTTVSLPARLRIEGTNSSGSTSQEVDLVAYQPSGGGATDAAFDLRVRKNGDAYGSPSTVMTLRGDSGNVGIGTTSPVAKLNVDGGDVVVGASAAQGHFEARYTNSDNYKASLGWNHLQLGNNAVSNYIIAGRTATSGGLTFVVNNTNNFRHGTTSHNGTEAMIINAAGNVGIGVSDPADKLEVAGSLRVSGSYPLWRSLNTAAASGSQGWQIQNNGSLFFGSTDDSFGWQNSSHLVLTRAGRVGINTSSPAGALEIQDGDPRIILDDTNGNVGGYVGFYSGGSYRWAFFDYPADNHLYIQGTAGTNMRVAPGTHSWAATSDVRLKRNIETLSVLDRLDDYRAVSFDWKKTGRHDIGVVAQEFYEIFPELVNKGDNLPEPASDKEGVWSVQYDRIGALALQAVKELKAENDALRAEIEAINARLNAEDGE